jgi:hypothetical protein
LLVGVDGNAVRYGMALHVTFVDVVNEQGETMLIPMFQANAACPTT